MSQKAYDIKKVWFKFRLLGLTVQLRRLYMNSQPSGYCTVFTISTDAHEVRNQ